MEEPDLSWLYRDTQQRLLALVSGLDDVAMNTPVPACPGWAVRDVLAHLTAIAEDALAGRLTGPPSEDETAVQVARFAGHDVADMLALWDELTPQFAEVVAGFRVWPAVIDVVSHEQDIRGTLDRPGARDCEVVRHVTDFLLTGMECPVPVRVAVEDAEFHIGPPAEAELALRTSRFEALRWRMGRRSRAQLAALAWSGDPSAVLDHLVIFGPAGCDIHE